MIIIFIGPPGSGKGTHSELLCQTYGLFTVSTGDILRQRMNAKDEVAKQIQKMMSTGELFPDEMINEFLIEAIEALTKAPNYKGLLFDGYPRTVRQAQFLENILTKLNLKIDSVFVLKVANEVILDRLTSRRMDRKTGKIYNLKSFPPPPDCDLYQRVDDTAEVIINRIEIYYKESSPLIEYYSQFDFLKVIDSSGTVKDIQDRLDSHLPHLNLI